MDSETWSLLGTIAAIALVSGFVHSAIGFGFGIVAISLIPMVIDARTAHVVVSISSVPMLVAAAWAYRKGIEWSSLVQALLGAAIFVPIGLAMFETASLDWLVRGTGVAILGMVVLNQYIEKISRRRKATGQASPEADSRSSRLACFAAGGLAGFLGGAVSIAGPPIAAFALKQDWPQERFKAFVTQCLLVIAAYKGFLLIHRGYFVGDVVWQSVVTAALAIVGVQGGVWASRRVPAHRFKMLVAIALVVVSCSMIWRGSGGGKGADAGTHSSETSSR